LSSFNLTNEEVENYNVVVARLNTYFNVRTNVIYERAVFNHLNQNDSDSVDDFLTRLYSQVDVSLWQPAGRDVERESLLA